MENEKANIEFGEVKRVFTGINADARELGVSRSHLWRVLRGERKSPELLERYRELRAEQADSGSAQ